MLCEITARHNDEESGDQLTDNACFTWSVVAAVSRIEQNDIVSTLYIGTEFPGYTVSNDTKRHYQI